MRRLDSSLNGIVLNGWDCFGGIIWEIHNPATELGPDAFYPDVIPTPVEGFVEKSFQGRTKGPIRS